MVPGHTLLHAGVIRAAAPFRHHPSNVLCRIFDITGFTVHAVCRINLKSHFVCVIADYFENTGRAIGRNVLVIAIGFVPMLFSTLVPYITVGSFFLAIMIVSGLVTMLLLPAISRSFNKSLFRVKKTETEPVRSVAG